jgi:hypothetical protein
MAEMAVAIMVVSLPSMRSFLRRGGIFSSHKFSGSSSSNTKYGLRTPIAKHHSFRGKSHARAQRDEDSGSEVELTTMGRTDVIYKTRHVSVQFSKSLDDSAERPEKLP